MANNTKLTQLYEKASNIEIKIKKLEKEQQTLLSMHEQVCKEINKLENAERY